MPWKGAQKTWEDKLLDIMAVLPSMMEEADSVRLQTQPSSTLSVTISLAGRCRSLICELELWLQLWSAASTQPLHWVKPSAIYKEIDSKPPDKGLPMALHFADLESAHLENLYWASLLLIHATFWVTCEWVMEFSPLAPGLARDSEHKITDLAIHPITSILHPLAPLSEIHTYAIHIAQSLEYFLQPELGAAGSSLIGFPMMVAMGYFEHFRLPEVSWFNVILGRFQRLGIPLEQFLNGMANEAVATLVRE